MINRDNKQNRKRMERRFERGFYKDKDSYTMAKNSVYRGELSVRATKSELIVKEFLEEQGVKFIFQKGFIKPFHRIADFYLKSIKTILEVDGGYHKDIEEKDRVKDSLWLKERGIKTIRITNEQVYNNEYQGILHANNIKTKRQSRNRTINL